MGIVRSAVLGPLLQRLLGSLLAFFLASGTVPGRAADPPTTPFLRIHGDDHTAVILGLAASPDGRLIGTASYDRTIRFWSAQSLEPIATVHLPAGEGIEGATFTAEFSPDSQTFVTGGWTGGWNGGQGPWCFYVVDVKTAQLSRAVCDMPTAANHFSFSPDGKYLAAMLKVDGVRIYRTADYSVAFQDRDYQEAGIWVEYSGPRRLVTSAADGKVRLYEHDERELRLIASRTLPDARKPNGLSVSPDGKLIAVGYSEPEAGDPIWPPAVDVISADNLATVFRPAMGGIEGGSLRRVAWSADGSTLYAGGTWHKGNRYPLRRWANGGRGRPADIASAPSEIIRLRALPQGGLVFAGSVASLTVVGTSDRVVAERQAIIADYTDIGDKLGISADGLTVQFAFERSAARPASFSLSDHQMRFGEAAVAMTFPVTDHPDLDVRDWANSYAPTLDGKLLPMVRADEKTYALAFMPKHKSFVLATSYNVIRYDSEGKILWSTKVPFRARGVVVSDDARLVVAAISDGTIRWYAADTGLELVAFFPHRDGERWVAWTPSGYYMASVGGDGLIGWQVNRGRDRASDFFDAGTFSDQYYRPDIVIRTLAMKDEGVAIRRANLESKRSNVGTSDVAALLPPVVEIIEPAEGQVVDTPTVKIRYRIRTHSKEPVTRIELRTDNRPFGTYDPPQLSGPGEVEASMTILMPPKDTEFLMFASNRHTTSPPARLRLHWRGPGSYASDARRKVYVLAVGVSNYREAGIRLDFPAKDARDFAKILEQQKGTAFADVITKVLVDKDATLPSLRSGLKWLQDNVGPDDIGIAFLAGHGVDEETNGVYHYLTQDVDLDNIAASSLDYQELVTAIRSIRGKIVLFLDTCHSGNVLGAAGKAAVDVNKLVSNLGRPQHGLVVFASSTGDQRSIESEAWKNGAFTKAVVEGLDGEAKLGDRPYVTTTMLAGYVKERVRDLTANMQWPTISMPLNFTDIRLAVVPNKHTARPLRQR